MIFDFCDRRTTHGPTVINHANQVLVFQITLTLLFKKLSIHKQFDVQHGFVIIHNLVFNLTGETFHENFVANLIFFNHILSN